MKKFDLGRNPITFFGIPLAFFWGCGFAKIDKILESLDYFGQTVFVVLLISLFLTVLSFYWYRSRFRVKGDMEMNDGGVVINQKSQGWLNQFEAWENITGVTFDSKKPIVYIHTKIGARYDLEVKGSDVGNLLTCFKNRGIMDFDSMLRQYSNFMQMHYG